MSDFKEGDKVTLIKEYHRPNYYKIGEVYTLHYCVFGDLTVNVNPLKEDIDGDFIYESAKGYFKLVESVEPAVTKNEGTGWGFENV